MSINTIAQYLFILFLPFLFSACSMTRSVSVSADGTIIRMNSSKLMWQKERSPRFTTWEEANNYANALEVGGHTDWRLPTKEELLDLFYAFDYGSANAKTLGIEIDCNYWSSSEDPLMSAGAWKDGNKCEIDRSFKPSTSGYVRAVRP